jgi:hypothetical protein
LNPLLDLVEELRSELKDQLASKQTSGVVWRTGQLERWLESLEAYGPHATADEMIIAAIDLLRRSVEQLEPVHASMILGALVSPEAVFAALKAEAMLDASLAKANRNPATSADHARLTPEQQRARCVAEADVEAEETT